MLKDNQACDGHGEEDMLVDGQHSGDFLVKKYEFIPNTWNYLNYHVMRSRLPGDYAQFFKSY